MPKGERKPKTVARDVRMRAMLAADASRYRWGLKRWATALRCGITAVYKSEPWQVDIRAWRAKAGVTDRRFALSPCTNRSKSNTI